jgi:hypothetical protein
MLVDATSCHVNIAKPPCKRQPLSGGTSIAGQNPVPGATPAPSPSAYRRAICISALGNFGLALGQNGAGRFAMFGELDDPHPAPLDAPAVGGAGDELMRDSVGWRGRPITGAQAG